MATEAPSKPRAPIERTEHPHVVKSADTLRGEPRIEDTRIPVLQVFEMVEGGSPSMRSSRGFPTLPELRSTVR